MTLPLALGLASLSGRCEVSLALEGVRASPVLQASILDLHSGALSVGKHFVNLYR